MRLIEHLNGMESELTYVRGDHCIEVWYTETERPYMVETLGEAGAILRLQELLVQWAADNVPGISGAIAYIASYYHPNPAERSEADIPHRPPY